MSSRVRKTMLAVAAAVAVAASACGGGGDSSGIATLVGTPSTVEAADPPGAAADPESAAATQPSGGGESQVVGTGSGGGEASGPTGGGEASGSVNGAAAVAESDTGEQEAALEDLTDGEQAAALEDMTDGEQAAALEDMTDGEQAAALEDMTDEERLLEFAECMRENGVDFPDPVVEADGTVTFGLRPGAGDGGGQRLQDIGRDPDLPAAQEACSGLLEGLAFGPGQGGSDQTELQDTLLEFAQCMRDNGVDMGDPDLRNFGPGADDDDPPGGPFGGIDFDDPGVSSAFETCQ